MVKATKEESVFVTLKPDIYIAEYKGCEETQILNKKTNEMDRVLKHYWQAEVLNNICQMQKVELNEISDIKMTGKNKLGVIAEALLGREVKIGETIDFDSLVGKKARLTVKNKKVGDVVYNTITDHLQLS